MNKESRATHDQFLANRHEISASLRGWPQDCRKHLAGKHSFGEFQWPIG
jgi:hypothetical protein